jgi:hypothetical protein
LTTSPDAKTSLTDKVLMATVGGLLAYEAYTLINKESADTISERIRNASRKRTYLTFFAGLLCGHWFWPLQDEDQKD